MKKIVFLLGLLLMLLMVGCAPTNYYVVTKDFEEDEEAIEINKIEKLPPHCLLVVNESVFTLKFQEPENPYRIFILPPGGHMVLKVKERAYILTFVHAFTEERYKEVKIRVNGVRNDFTYCGKTYDAIIRIEQKKERHCW